MNGERRGLDALLRKIFLCYAHIEVHIMFMSSTRFFLLRSKVRDVIKSVSFNMNVLSLFGREVRGVMNLIKFVIIRVGK